MSSVGTSAGISTIRDLFSQRRPIDRPIEKVIDYYATDERRLLAEVEEYEVTDNVERNFRRFLDAFGAGVRTGQVTETGIWVSGFYGSGKSSFTKYLGFALDPDRRVGGRPFLDLLLERINQADVKSELRALAQREPVAVIMLDLGSEQLASSATASISTVLYWKVLQWAGYSKVEKLAQLELRLERDGRMDEFLTTHQARFNRAWESVHNDPLAGVQFADQIVPRFYPQEFAEKGAFSKLHAPRMIDARTQVVEMLELIRRRSGRQNVLFLIDEAGQYVAPRSELILNMDGLARNIKEVGKGRAWIVATGQQTLTEIRELGLVDDPQAGGVAFLSDSLKPIVSDRNAYRPSAAEVAGLRSRILQGLFETPPSATLEGAKTVRAGVHYGKAPIAGDDEEVQFRLETANGANWEERRTVLLTETTGHAEWRNTIAWLLRPDDSVEDALVEVLRSQYIRRKTSESEATHDVAQYLRAELSAERGYEERVRTLYGKALLEGTMIFRGTPAPASSAGTTLEAAARKVLGDAAAKIYPQFHLVNIRPGTDLAAKFLDVERLDRMPRERDPLGFVTVLAGKPRIDVQHRALAEALRVFGELLRDAGTGRLQGSAIQDRFAAPPYGWSKDATRYVFAALLTAGEVVLHTAAGVVSTAGPAAVEAMRNTQSFGRIGVSLRDSRPTLEALDRAATRLQEMTGNEVLPLENDIGSAVRASMPGIMAPCAALPERLRLLGLAGEDRAQTLLATGRDVQAQDGAAAIGILGMPDCAFPADLAWGRAVTRALDNGAEQDVTAARSVLREAVNLERDWPDLLLLEEAERATMQDILGMDTFYERLAELRGTVRGVRDRAASIYRDERNAHVEALRAARNCLEALLGWTRITEADRAEIAGRLSCDVPDAPPDGQELALLARLLLLRARLPALQQSLAQDVARRLPAGPSGPEEPGPDEPIDLPLSLVASATVIHDDAELTAWLRAVEAAIRNSMAAGAPVRIVVHP